MSTPNRAARPVPPRGTATVGFVFGATNASALPGPVLVTLLGRLGIAPTAARQLLKRLRDLGSLTTTPAGRVVVYRPTGAFADTLDSLRREPVATAAWEGHFHTVIYDLPESHRVERDRLRAAGFAAGCAALRPGVLVGVASPDWLQEFSSVRNIPAVLEAGRLSVPVESARRIAEQAWDLPEHRRRITRTIETVRNVSPADPDDGWSNLTALHDVFAAATPTWLATPRLPRELVPDGLGSDTLDHAVTTAARSFGEAMQPTLSAFLADHPQAHLVETTDRIRY